MGGGKSILTGVVLLIVFLVSITVYHAAHGLWVLIGGGIPLLLAAAGVVLIWIGIMDLKPPKSDTAQIAK